MSSFFFKKKADKTKNVKHHNSDDDFDEIDDVEEVLHEEKKIDQPDLYYRSKEWPSGFYFRVEVVETQRRFPGGDFGPRSRLPTDRYLMATLDGKIERKLSDVTRELPVATCEWVTPWEVYQGTDPQDHYVNSGGGALMASLTGNKEEAKIELLSRFDEGGWEYANDFPREYHPHPIKMKDWVRRRFWRRVFVAKVRLDFHIPFPENFRAVMHTALVQRKEYMDHIKLLSQNRRACITEETEQSEQRRAQEIKRLEMQKKVEDELRKQKAKEDALQQKKDKLFDAFGSLGHAASGLFQSKSHENMAAAEEEVVPSTFLVDPGEGFTVVEGDVGGDGDEYGISSPCIASKSNDPERFSQLFLVENAKRRQLASERRQEFEGIASSFVSERFRLAAAVAKAEAEQLKRESEEADAAAQSVGLKNKAKSSNRLSASQVQFNSEAMMSDTASQAGSPISVVDSDDDTVDPDKPDAEYRNCEWPSGYSFMVEVMESQRYFPLGGWSHKRLLTDPVKYPFASNDGKTKRNLNRVAKELPKEYAEWVTPWEVYFGTDLGDQYKGSAELSRFDDNGWEYATSFRIGAFKNNQFTGSFVRRRFWRRFFVATVGLKVQVPFPDAFKLILGDAKESDYKESVKMLRRNRIASITKQQVEAVTTRKSLPKSESGGILGSLGLKSADSIDEMSSSSPKAEDTAALSLLHALDDEGTAFDDSIAWSKFNIFLVEVVETQRKWPLGGWTDKRLPTDRPAFATADGHLSRPLALVDSELPAPNCVWVSPWQIFIGSGNDRGRFDEDGWEYAFDFPSKFSRQPTMTTNVRRRFWRRVFAVVDEDGKFQFPQTLNSVMTPLKISKNAYAVAVQHPTNAQLARKNDSGGGLLGFLGGGSIRRTESQSSMGASSFASTVYDPTDCDRYVDVPWTKSRTFKVRVVETQRRFPIGGWSDRRLPTDRFAFANEEGTLERKLSVVTQELPRDSCQWITPWQIVVDPNTEDVAALVEDDPSSPDTQELQKRAKTRFFDEDGWEYAIDFPREFHRDFNKLGHWVRRRFWERIFRLSEPSQIGVETVAAGSRSSVRVISHPADDEGAHKHATARMSLTARFSAGTSLSSTGIFNSTKGPTSSANATLTEVDPINVLDDTVVLIPSNIDFPDEFENIIRRLDESKMVYYTNHKKLEGEDLARQNDGGGGLGKFFGGILGASAKSGDSSSSPHMDNIFGNALRFGVSGFKNAVNTISEVASPLLGLDPHSPFGGAITMGSYEGERLSLEEHTARKEIFAEVATCLQAFEDSFLDKLADATARQARREIREKERRRRHVLDKNSFSPDGRKGSLTVTVREGRRLYKHNSEVGKPVQVYLACEYRGSTVGESSDVTTTNRSPAFDAEFPMWISDDRSTIELNVYVRTGITGAGELKWRTGINLSRPLTNVVRVVEEDTLTFIEEGLVELPLLNYVPSGGLLQSAETLFPFLAAATTWSEKKEADVAETTTGFKGDRPSLIVGWKFEIREDDPASNVGFCHVCARLQDNCKCSPATKAARHKSEKLAKARRRRDEFIAQKAREEREMKNLEKREVVELRISRLRVEGESYRTFLDTFRSSRAELSSMMMDFHRERLAGWLFRLVKSYCYATDFRRAPGVRFLSHPAMLPCQRQGWLKPDAVRAKRVFLTWMFHHFQKKVANETSRVKNVESSLADIRTACARTLEADVDADQRLLFDREEEYVNGRRSVRDEMAKALNLTAKQLLQMKWDQQPTNTNASSSKMKANSCCAMQ